MQGVCRVPAGATGLGLICWAGGQCVLGGTASAQCGLCALLIAVYSRYGRTRLAEAMPWSGAYAHAWQAFAPTNCLVIAWEGFNSMNRETITCNDCAAPCKHRCCEGLSCLIKGVGVHVMETCTACLVPQLLQHQGTQVRYPQHVPCCGTCRHGRRP